MHLVKALENSANAKADKPYIRQEYYPIGVKKYITFQPFSKYHSKNYPYWGDVLKMVGAKLNKLGITIVQLGGPKEELFEGTYNCVGKTTINQSAYIIQNGLFHVGADSFMTHIAGAMGKPVVSVYGNNYIDNVKPYWHDKFYGFDGYKNIKPCFSEVDPNKAIYDIEPDKIAKAIYDLLNIEFDFPFEILWTGQQCHRQRIDVVPNQVLDPKTFKVGGYVIRMDYEHNEKMMLGQLSQCPCTILANQPIDTDLIPYKNRIVEFAYEITSKDDAEFVSYLHQAGINYYLFTYLDEKELNKIKIDFLDFHPIIIHETEEPDELFNKYDSNDLFFESKRIILSNQKIYLTKSAMEYNSPVPTIHQIQQFNTKFITKDLYRDIDFLRFFKLKKK